MNQISIYNLDSHKEEIIELSDNEAENIRRLIVILDRDLEMEILHDLIIESLWEYRNKVDYWRLRSLGSFRTQTLRYQVKSTLNRMAFNILNLSKLFLDKHYHKKDKICFVHEQTKSLNDKTEVELKIDTIYKENLRYIIGCKLRNRSQHSQLPILNFSNGFKTRKTDNKKFITFGVTLDYNDLKKLKIPEERINKDSTFDLTDVLDGYVYAISEMHMHNRTLIEETIISTREELKKIVEGTIAENQESCLIDLDSTDHPSEYIGLDRFYLATYLREKHAHAIDYSQFSFDVKGY